MCSTFASLGLISARFAARLVRAGALSALMRLAEKAVGLGLGLASGAGADAATAQTYAAVLECIEAFAPSVPQARPWGCCHLHCAAWCIH